MFLGRGFTDPEPLTDLTNLCDSICELGLGNKTLTLDKDELWLLSYEYGRDAIREAQQEDQGGQNDDKDTR